VPGRAQAQAPRFAREHHRNDAPDHRRGRSVDDDSADSRRIDVREHEERHAFTGNVAVHHSRAEDTTFCIKFTEQPQVEIRIDPAAADGCRRVALQRSQRLLKPDERCGAALRDDLAAVAFDDDAARTKGVPTSGRR
jgi:hypothetical protein